MAYLTNAMLHQLMDLQAASESLPVTLQLFLRKNIWLIRHNNHVFASRREAQQYIDTLVHLVQLGVQE